MIFIDADFFIGFYYKEDAHHQRCKFLYDHINTSLVSSWDVVDETATKLTYFTSKIHALKFLDGIERTKIEIIYPDRDLFLQAKYIFQQQTTKKISLTDCMNMAIAKSLDITTFLSFDQIYEKNGFTLFS